MIMSATPDRCALLCFVNLVIAMCTRTHAFAHIMRQVVTRACAFSVCFAATVFHAQSTWRPLRPGFAILTHYDPSVPAP